ncbi:hypothetical protein Tco_0806887 [Tanacetum coccineum]
MKFLMGINDAFQPIQSSVLSTETLPDVKDAFAIVSREEFHRRIASSSSGSIYTLGSNPDLLSKNYGKDGHTIDRCFDLLGYLLEYNENPGSKQNGFKTFNANFASTSSENGTTLSFANEKNNEIDESH